MSAMKIKELPFNVIWQLCLYLDRYDLPQQNWRALLANAPGTPYRALDVAAFERVGQRPNGSPTESVIQDFITRGFTVNELFCMLRAIGHLEGMRTLGKYVSPSLQRQLQEKEGVRKESELQSEDTRTAEDYKLPDSTSSPDPPPPSPPPIDIHPEFGPLPPDPFIARGPYLEQRKNSSEVESTNERRDDRSNCASTCGLLNSPASVALSSYQNGIQTPQDVWNGMETPPQQGYSPAVSVSSWPRVSPPGAIQHGLRQSSEPVQLPEAIQRPRAPLYANIPGPAVGPMRGPAMEIRAMVYPSGENPPVQSHAPIQSQQPQQRPHPPSQAKPLSADVTLNILTFLYDELSEATGDFTVGMIGIGSFGSVFKAMVRGNGPYAIKKLHNQSEFSEMEGSMFYETTFHQETFTQELQLLTRYHHRNILSLVAYSNDGPRPCLVYEYMENGSLSDCLLGRRNVFLPWSLRLEIADQIADTLHFLHTVNKPKCLVHGDVKSANILLDSHFVPKLSDFGLARECQSKAHQKSTYCTQSSVVMGTMAYLAPEFLRNRKLTPKMDVYSFGVVLLELYTGLAADDPTVQQRALTDRLFHLLEETEEGTPAAIQQRQEIIARADHRAAWPEGIGFDFFEIATVCLRTQAKKRPPMEQVRAQLSHLSTEGAMAHLHLSGTPSHSVHGQMTPDSYSYSSDPSSQVRMVMPEWSYNGQHQSSS